MFWISKDVAEIKQAVARIEILQSEMKEDVKQHIRRTANLEGRTESIEKHVHMVQGMMKFCGYVAGFLTLVATVGGAIVAYFH